MYYPAILSVVQGKLLVRLYSVHTIKWLPLIGGVCFFNVSDKGKEIGKFAEVAFEEWKKKLMWGNVPLLYSFSKIIMTETKSAGFVLPGVWFWFWYWLVALF